MFTKKYQVKIIVVLIFLAFVFLLTQNKTIYTFSMMRHGAAYPPNGLYDGNQTISFRGLLTPVGLRQHYNLGTYLKQNYITQQQLLSPTFKPKQVEFFSTSYNRTQNSALAFLYGFFPLGQGWRIPSQVPKDKLDPPYTPLYPDKLKKQLDQQQFGLDKGFQPLPVRPLDDILDNCPQYDYLWLRRKIQIGETLYNFEQLHRKFVYRMSSIFKLLPSEQSLQNMSDLYETIYADMNLGRPLPTNYTSDDHRYLKYIYQYYNTMILDGNFGKVLSTASFRLLRSKLLKALNKSDLKSSFIFGHQSNVHPILTLMNLTSAECLTQQFNNQTVTALNCVEPPRFAANLIFQLNEQNSNNYVRVRYNGYYVNLCQKKDTSCSYQEFIERIEEIETNFEAQCGITSPLSTVEK